MKTTAKKVFLPILMITILMMGVMAFGTTASAADSTVCLVCQTPYENGFCSCEGVNSYQPVVKNAEGIYEIGNAGQLYAFAELINTTYFEEISETKDSITVNAVLTSNITVNEKVTENGEIVSDTSGLRNWTAINDINTTGEIGRTYVTINFDGNGKIISGLYSKSNYGTALFGYMRGSVSSLGIVDSVFDSLYSYNTASIIQEAFEVTVTDCFSTAIVKGTYLYCGGIAGEGNVNTVIENCYFGGKLINLGENNAIICDHYKDESVVNCYYLDSVGSGSKTAYPISEEDVLSGKLTYLLNKGVTDGTQIWYQTTGVGSPAFSGETVYASEPCNSIFTNFPQSESELHSFVDNAGYDLTHHWTSVCEKCKLVEQKTEHSVNNENDLCDCGYLPMFKIVNESGESVYYGEIGSFELEDGDVLYLLKDVEDNKSIVIDVEGTAYFDINGKNLKAELTLYDPIIVIDSSSEKTGIINDWLSMYSESEIMICGVTLGENVTLYVSSDSNFVLEDTVIKSPDFIHPANNQGAIKIRSAVLENGIVSWGDGSLSTYLYDNGYFVDADGNMIEITEGQTEINEKCEIKTNTLSVTADGNTTYYEKLFDLQNDLTNFGDAKITFLENYTPAIRESLMLSENGEYTIDLAGNTVSNVLFAFHTNVTIEDSSEAKTGTINQVPGINTLQMNTANTLTVNGGNINCDFIVSEGYLVINDGIFTGEQIYVTANSLTINGGEFLSKIEIQNYSDGDVTIEIRGGNFAGLKLTNLVLSEVIAENYITVNSENIFIFDADATEINEAFTLIAHTHQYVLQYDELEHWYACICGIVDISRPKEMHSGGIATCDDGPLCQVCNVMYDTSLGHDYSEDYISVGDGTHKKVCSRDENHVEISGCYTEEYVLCGEKAVCDLCNKAYGEVVEHDFSSEEYIQSDDGKHYVLCSREYCDEESEHEDCIPGEAATCDEDQICTICYGVLVKAKGHTESIPATCNDPAYCSVCEDYYGDPLDHDYVDGVCAICNDALPIKVIFNSFGSMYFDSFQELFMAMLIYNFDSVEIILLDDVDLLEEGSMQLMNGNITIDLAGHSLTNVSMLNIDANVTIIDSSEEKTGNISTGEESQYAFVTINGKITVNGGTINGGIVAMNKDAKLITINGGSVSGVIMGAFEMNGGALKDVTVVIDSESFVKNSVKGGSITNVFVIGDEATLTDVLSTASCISYVDAEGNSVTVDFSTVSLSGTIQVIHDDSHANKDSYGKDLYKHWFECENGVAAFAAPHTFGENATCTVCGGTAPFVVEANGKFYAYENFKNAFEDAIAMKNAKLTLNDNGIYFGSPILPYDSAIDGVNLTIDIKGNIISITQPLYIRESTVIIMDSNEDKSGIFEVSYIELENSRLMLNDVTLSSSVEIAIYSSYFAIDGVTFEDEFSFIYTDDSVLAVKNAIFENGVYLDENGIYDLAHYFNTECITVLDENGEPLTFDYGIFAYEYSFSVTHSEDCFLTGVVISVGDGTHWNICEHCGLRTDLEACSGGEANCVTGAVCDKCKAVYTDPVSHEYDENGACKICLEKAPFVVTDGENTWFFGTAYEAFDMAERLRTATIVMNANYSDFVYKEIEPSGDSVITVDLNGYTLSTYDINVYGITLIIKDTSKTKSGRLNILSTLDIYAGKVIFEGGNISDLNIDIDPEEDETALIINGGSFDSLNIDTDGDYYYSELRISGGNFEYIEFDLDHDIDLFITGGEYYTVYSEGDYYYYISDIFDRADCIIAVGGSGNRIFFDYYSYDCYDYFKIIHDDSKFDDAQMFADSEYHWYECQCGIVFEKTAHVGGSATCDELAICDVCYYEYGNEAPHSYNDELVCSACGDKADGMVKVEYDGYIYYFENISDAFEKASYLGEAVVTLLDDYAYNFDVLYIYDTRVTLNLNGFNLYISDIYLEDNSKLVITDESEAKTGALFIEYDVYMAKSELEIRAGKIKTLRIYTDTSYGVSSIVINDGSIDALEIIDYYGMPMSLNSNRTEVSKSNLTVRIKGGKFKTFSLGFGNDADVKISGGEFTEGIIIIGMNGKKLTLGDLLPAECYAYYTKYDEKIESIVSKGSALGYVKVLHTDSYVMISKADGHYEMCLCGATTSVEEHKYDNACDAKCNVCEGERTPADHVYDNACDAKCNVCEDERTPADHVYDNACDAKCNVCEGERTPADHVYDNACDAKCNVCEIERTPADHVYDNACDAKCNVCEGERTPADHVYDNACDAKCNVCEDERTPADHVYDNACDATCNVCAIAGTPKAHTFGDTETVTEPTKKHAGEGKMTCSECGHVEPVVIPEVEGMTAGAIATVTAVSTVSTLTGAFALYWFVIKKKAFSDLLSIFK